MAGCRCFLSLGGLRQACAVPAVSSSGCSGPAGWRAPALRPGLMTPSCSTVTGPVRQASENTQPFSAFAMSHTHTHTWTRAHTHTHKLIPALTWKNTHIHKHTPTHTRWFTLIAYLSPPCCWNLMNWDGECDDKHTNISSEINKVAINLIRTW